MTIDWTRCSARPARHFPWPDVHAAFAQLDAQVAAAAIAEAQQQFGAQARACPTCRRPPAALSWLSIGAGEQAWAAGDRRCGWLTICAGCCEQVDFILDELMVELRLDGNW
jgi:hypothetical protein